MLSFRRIELFVVLLNQFRWGVVVVPAGKEIDWDINAWYLLKEVNAGNIVPKIPYSEVRVYAIFYDLHPRILRAE